MVSKLETSNPLFPKKGSIGNRKTLWSIYKTNPWKQYSKYIHGQFLMTNLEKNIENPSVLLSYYRFIHVFICIYTHIYLHTDTRNKTCYCSYDIGISYSSPVKVFIKIDFA